MGSDERGGLLISSIPLPRYVRAIHGPSGSPCVGRNFKAFGEFPAGELEAQTPADDSMSGVGDTMSEPP